MYLSESRLVNSWQSDYLLHTFRLYITNLVMAKTIPDTMCVPKDSLENLVTCICNFMYTQQIL